MEKIEEARMFLSEIGMPKEQQSDICCYTLLALADIKPESSWNKASNEWIRIHDILQFISKEYGESYAENSRETFRKQALKPFRTSALVEDNGKATNSPNFRYRLTDEAVSLIRLIDTDLWYESLSQYKRDHETLIRKYSSKKTQEKMPVKINEKAYTFSPGEHNELQKAILEEFAPRFAPNSECLYVGDTTDKDLVKNDLRLQSLGFGIIVHDQMPDVILFREDKDWIYFIEAVTSVGPMDPKRILEISEMTKDVQSSKIFITAFLDFKTYKKFSDKLAWETEVWIAEYPDHMIHLNGDKFIGPRNSN